jgi:hypothetical protein
MLLVEFRCVPGSGHVHLAMICLDDPMEHLGTVRTLLTERVKRLV